MSSPYNCGCRQFCTVATVTVADLCEWHRGRYQLYLSRTDDPNPISLLVWLRGYYRYDERYKQLPDVCAQYPAPEHSVSTITEGVHWDKSWITEANPYGWKKGIILRGPGSAESFKKITMKWWVRQLFGCLLVGTLFYAIYHILDIAVYITNLFPRR